MTGYKSKYPLDQQTFVRDAWDAGVSASLISQRMNHAFGLNTTRNSIISLTKRLGCPLRESNGPWQLEGRARRDATLAATHGPRIRKPVPALPEGCEIPPAPLGPLNEHAESGCQWIYGDTQTQFQYCANPQAPRRPYCPHHCHAAKGAQAKPMVGSSRSARQFR